MQSSDDNDDAAVAAATAHDDDDFCDELTTWTLLLFALFAAGDMDHSQYDCFVLAVMTHGDEGNTFYGVDGKAFTLAQLMAPIKRCRTLAGKPKICIIQVSRLTPVEGCGSQRGVLCYFIVIFVILLYCLWWFCFR